MRPTDKTLGSFEEKAAQSVPLTGLTHLTSREIAAVKSRIRFVLFGANPDDLSVAQVGEWCRRVVPGMRRAAGMIEAHADLPVEAAPAYAEEALAAGEIICALVGDRRVRFSPSTMVVTPLRLSSEE